MEEVPPSTESTADLPRPQDGDMPFSSRDREGSYVEDGAISPDYGPTPSVSSIPPSITPSASSDVHPFKLERYVDNKGNTRTRVYLGRLRYLINNFDVVIQSDTRSTTSYSGSMGSGSSEITGPESGHTHSGTSTVTLPAHTHTQGGTAEEKTGSDITEGVTIQNSDTQHTHATTGMSVPMADHYHKSGEASNSGGTAAGQQLKFRQHTHSLPNITGDPTSGGSYSGGDHTHDLGGSTGNVDNFGSSPPAPEDITGNTGGVGHSFPDQQISGAISQEGSHSHKYKKDDHSHTLTGQTGGIHGSAPTFDITTGSSTGHTHPLPVLSNNTVTVDSFICVKNQSQGAGFINEIEPDGFTAIKDSNDKDTVLKAKDMPINQTYGSFFLKWSIILPTGSASGATIAADSITIHRDSDPTKTAEQLQNDFGGMSALTANSETAAMGSFKRGSHSEADRTATYYVKLGVSYDPNAAGTNSKSIEQITYENVYWCPLFISSIPS